VQIEPSTPRFDWSRVRHLDLCLDDRVSTCVGTRDQLGGMKGLEHPFPERPKGMWNRTYRRLFQAYVAAENTVMADWNRRLHQK
jgi:hypothetical protein